MIHTISFVNGFLFFCPKVSWCGTVEAEIKVFAENPDPSKVPSPEYSFTCLACCQEVCLISAFSCPSHSSIFLIIYIVWLVLKQWLRLLLALNFVLPWCNVCGWQGISCNDNESICTGQNLVHPSDRTMLSACTHSHAHTGTHTREYTIHNLQP